MKKLLILFISIMMMSSTTFATNNIKTNNKKSIYIVEEVNGVEEIVSEYIVTNGVYEVIYQKDSKYMKNVVKNLLSTIDKSIVKMPKQYNKMAFIYESLGDNDMSNSENGKYDFKDIVSDFYKGYNEVFKDGFDDTLKNRGLIVSSIFTPIETKLNDVYGISKDDARYILLTSLNKDMIELVCSPMAMWDDEKINDIKVKEKEFNRLYSGASN